MGWGLATWAGVQFAGALLERSTIAALAVQAAVAEWGSGTAGVAWSEERAGRGRSIARRCAIGAFAGAAAACAALTASCAVGTAHLEPAAPAVAPLALGWVVALLGAVRDELVLRGVARETARGRMPAWAGLMVCGAVGAAARLGTDGPQAMPIAREALAGIAFGALWQLDQGAFMPIAAHTAWAWVNGPLAHGSIVDLRFRADPSDDMPSFVVLAAAALGAAARALRRRSGRGAVAEGRPDTE